MEDFMKVFVGVELLNLLSR